MVQDGLKKLAECLGKNFHKVLEAVMKADLGGLIKLGILVGVSIGTIILIFKFLRDKKKAFFDEEGKDPVDKTLDLNYHDLRQQDKLHPMMKKVRKQLVKDLKPRRKGGKRKSSYKKDVIRRYSDDARERQKHDDNRAKKYRSNRFETDDDYDLEADTADANARLKYFLDHEDDFREEYPNVDDYESLHRVWTDTNNHW